MGIALPGRGAAFGSPFASGFEQFDTLQFRGGVKFPRRVGPNVEIALNPNGRSSTIQPRSVEIRATDLGLNAVAAVHDQARLN